MNNKTKIPAMQPVPVRSQITAVSVCLNYTHYADIRKKQRQQQELKKLKKKFLSTAKKHSTNKLEKDKNSDNDCDNAATTSTHSPVSSTKSYEKHDEVDYYQYQKFFDTLLADEGVAEHFTAYVPGGGENQTQKYVIDTSEMKALLLQLKNPARFF